MADGGISAGADGYNYKPCAAMVATQCIFAAMTLWVKAAFGRGMSPMVFVVYRQAVATLVLAPIAIIANRARLKEMRLGMKAFLLVFLAALFGATANQNLCYQGLYLGTSSLATTMTNLIPAITFVMAVAVGQERVNIGEVSSTAKIFGTAVYVGGAITIAFFKGPKLRSEFLSDPLTLLHELSSRDWVMGALFLVGSSSCWSLWLILQGPICERLVGAVAVIAGLYIVLWGKAEDARTGRIPPALMSRDCAKAAATDVVVEPHGPHRSHSHSQLDLENSLAAPLMAAGKERAQARN